MKGTSGRLYCLITGHTYHLLLDLFANSGGRYCLFTSLHLTYCNWITSVGFQIRIICRVLPVATAVLQNSEHVTSRYSIFWDAKLGRWLSTFRRIVVPSDACSKRRQPLAQRRQVMFQKTGNPHSYSALNSCSWSDVARDTV